jgi:uncharacterized protein
MPQHRPAQPVPADERILALDVLRGFAMFGVLLAYCLWNLGTAGEESWSALDKALDPLAAFAIDGKFYTILAFLFGLGFSIQLSRASDDAAAVDSYCRRLAVLSAIGLLHALLLRNGDILLPYALTGFLLVPLRRQPDRLLAIVAAIALLVPHVARMAWDASGIPIPQRPQLENAGYLVENAAWLRYWYQTAILSWPTNLTLFVIGLLAGRHRLVATLSKRPRTLVAIAAAGSVLGLATHLVRAEVAGGTGLLAEPAAGLLYTFHCWALASAYAAALLFALRSVAGRSALAPLAAVGRLALTNYLLQAVLVVPLCLAFGWFDTFTPSGSLLLALPIFFLVQIPFSLWWLGRFQFGPVEWVWRMLTYGYVPPLRRSQGRAAPVRESRLL